MTQDDVACFLVSAASGNLPYALGPGAAPLALGAVLWYLRAPSAGRLLASSFALALCAYGGDPQSVGIAILAALVLAVAERPRPRRAVLVLSWAACGLLLCAPVALPAVSQLQRSDRRAGVIEGDRMRPNSPLIRPRCIAKKTILVADDNVRIRETLAKVFGARA